MIVNYAKEALVDEMKADADISDWKYVGFGTGAGGASLTDTALTTEVSGGSYARLTATQAEENADQLKLTGTWTNNSGSQQEITEIGLFDAASDGNLIARVTSADGNFSAKTIDDGDDLEISWIITVNDDSE